LLGGEAGLRCSETIALAWGDVDLAKGQLCVRRSAGATGRAGRAAEGWATPGTCRSLDG
jgi:integrase